MMTQQERAARYLARLPVAIAGQGGHAATFAAACRLVEFGLAEAEAWSVLEAWNQSHCQPPWSEGELRHKLADAFNSTQPRPDFLTAGNVTRRPRAAPALSPVTHQAKPAIDATRAATSDSRRPMLPPIVRGNDAQLAALAALRGLSLAALKLADERGLLRFGEHRGLDAWLIGDRSSRVAQARRVDGLPWADGVKAWTLPGSQASWPVGIPEADAYPVIAFCEGGPDLLAAFHFMAAEGRAGDVAPVAMLGAAARIHPGALPQFRGKRVRIFRHSDAAGDKAVDRWTGQLREAGAEVDAFALDGLCRADGDPVKDLNDLARVSPDVFAAYPCLQSLFP